METHSVFLDLGFPLIQFSFWSQIQLPKDTLNECLSECTNLK